MITSFALFRLATTASFFINEIFNLTKNLKLFGGMFFHSEPLIFIIQVLCFYKFANSFYKVTESQMALT